MENTAPVAAISYAHGPRDAEILALSNRLRREGVDCEIDFYEEAPPEGWARWMVEMMTKRTVLVVASQDYYRRFHLDEEIGKGRGATFESGLLVQRLVDMQGVNEGIIPVLLDPDDAEYIPEFLRDGTRYDLSKPDGYDRLYARLTGQRVYEKPPLGPIRKITHSADLGTSTAEVAKGVEIALFQTKDGMFGVRLLEIERAENLKLVLLPDDDGDVARVRSLAEGREAIGIAYASTAVFARVRNVSEISRQGERQIAIEMTEERIENSFGSESSFNGISADEIATMRARRILLDEKLPSRGNGTTDRLNDATFELFVAGHAMGRNGLSVKASPIPILARSMNIDEPQFIVLTRLACVLLLILSGTVEHVIRLELRRSGSGLDIHFEGVRHKVYSNREATPIAVDGTVPL